jgi:hypothetical protein
VCSNCRPVQALEFLWLDDAAMAQVGDQAARLPLHSDGELLGNAVGPSSEPGNDEVTVLEPHWSTAQGRVASGVRTTELFEEAIDDIYLERLQDGATALRYAGGIQMADG